MGEYAQCYPIEIHGLFTAPEHRVFGKGKEDVSGRDLQSNSRVKLIADSGIEGDRFCRLRPDYNGHVTFFSQEVWEEALTELHLPSSIGPEVTRRNVIISGVDLKALYGAPFVIRGIRFVGTVHCSPCPAMNRAIGPGATAALRRRGGLRAQVKTSGVLKLGRSELLTSMLLDPKNAGTQPPPLKLP